MFNSANCLHFTFEDFEESLLVLVLTYLDYFHCDKLPRVYIDSTKNLDNVSVSDNGCWGFSVGALAL